MDKQKSAEFSEHPSNWPTSLHRPPPHPPNLPLNKQEPQGDGGLEYKKRKNDDKKYTASQLIIGTNCLQSASHPEQAWLIAKRSKSNTIVVVVERQLQHMSVE
jgi:hypothetical protein